jgi:hypothetical protein
VRLGLLCLSRVADVTGVCDVELHAQCRAEICDQLGSPPVERPVADPPRQLDLQLAHVLVVVGVVIQQGADARPAKPVELGAEIHLPPHDSQGVDRDPREKGEPAVQRRLQVTFEELGHRVDELGRGRAIVGHHQLPSSASSRSHSISTTRRPSVASSTERTTPCRCAKACSTVITPHFTVPSTIQ